MYVCGFIFLHSSPISYPVVFLLQGEVRVEKWSSQPCFAKGLLSGGLIDRIPEKLKTSDFFACQSSSITRCISSSPGRDIMLASGDWDAIPGFISTRSFMLRHTPLSYRSRGEVGHTP